MAAPALCRIVLALGALLATPVFAASPADRQDCAGNADKPDVRIAACTRVIDDANETAAARVSAHNSRGSAYQAKKDYERALADYNASLQLDPKNPRTFNGRGNVYLA